MMEIKNGRQKQHHVQVSGLVENGRVLAGNATADIDTHLSSEVPLAAYRMHDTNSWQGRLERLGSVSGRLKSGLVIGGGFVHEELNSQEISMHMHKDF